MIDIFTFMERNTFIISGKKFNSKKDAITFYRKILNSYRVNSELSNKDFKLVYSLLQNHPRAKEKIGCGVKKIIVGKGYIKHKCFYIIRKDGSKVDFSYLKCINGNSSDFTMFSKACRKAVEKDIIFFKRKYFRRNSKAKCQVTGKLISADTAHVDHIFPNTFYAIVKSFIEYNKIDISTIEYETKGIQGAMFKDKNLETKFREYHRKVAKLRIVEDKVNLCNLKKI